MSNMPAFLPGFMKVLKPWQTAVLVVILLGAAGGTYGGYELASGSSGAGLGDGESLIPVQLGDLVNQVSTNGSLYFPERAALSFRAQGTVAQVLATEGQEVVEGQELARLDDATQASLERAAAKARIDLRNAEDALEETREPYTALDLAQAEAAVANARLDYLDARDALDRLLQPDDLDLAQAEASVANARLDYLDARDALDQLLQPDDLDLAQAEASVVDARLSQDAAREALDDLVAPVNQEDIARAEEDVASAGRSLDIARDDLFLVQKDWEGRVAEAGGALQEALTAYQDAFDKWLGIDPDLVTRQQDPATLLASLGVDMEVLFDPAAQDTLLGLFSRGPRPDDPATPWNEVIVYAWVNLTPGQILVSCDGIAIGSDTWCILDEMEEAWQSLQDSTDGLEQVENQRDRAEEALARDEAALEAARERQEALLEPPDPLEVESKEGQVALSMTALERAQEDLALLAGGAASTTDPRRLLEVESGEK